MTRAMLYVTEWTAADGSKRRPIVERVAECGPPYGYSIDYLNQQPGWIVRGSRVVGGVDVGEVASAALLRCAVEDWLIAKRGFEVSPVDPGGVEVKPLGCHIGFFARDGSIHAALIATAHVVADSQGIAP